MKNPIKKLKEEKHLTNRDLAILLGQSVGNISHLILGNYTKIPPATLKVMEKYGYDPDAMQKEYKQFRNSQRKLIEQKVAAI